MYICVHLWNSAFEAAMMVCACVEYTYIYMYAYYMYFKPVCIFVYICGVAQFRRYTSLQLCRTVELQQLQTRLKLL